jgi:serine/threonine-protein kinase
VALKTVLPAVRPPAGAVARFLREADVLRRVSHPNVVAFRASGEAGGLPWFAMEYVDGPDAARVVAREGPLPAGRAVAWAVQLLGALADAHGRGFVHRDVKPANLLIARAGDSEAVKLADFGLARAYQASRLSGLTVTGGRGGTPAFMPPEQALDFRSAKPAADQYAAGATLYFLLTGRHVLDHRGSVAEWFRQVLESEPVPLRSRRPDLPGPLADVVHRALARRPEHRFPDAAAFAAALRPFLAG